MEDEDDGYGYREEHFAVRSYVDTDKEKNFFKLFINIYYHSKNFEGSANLNKTFVYPFPRSMDDFLTWKKDREEESLAQYREFLKYLKMCDENPLRRIDISAEERKIITPFVWPKHDHWGY